MGQMQVRLPAEWLPALDEAARARGMTRSGFIRWLIGQHLQGVRHDAD
jgi:metal-responsive CopG/Arc/MetJ family transcriptional regulator